MSRTHNAVTAASAALLLAVGACGHPTTTADTSLGPNAASPSTTALNADPTSTQSTRGADRSEPQFTKDFRLEDCTFLTVGRNPFFPLIPGRTVIFKGEEAGNLLRLEQAVLNETLNVDGVQTRVLEEHHFQNGQLVEISRNYFAHCVQTNSVFYFGEDTDNYQDGKIINHNGTWRQGVNGARAGLVMPGIVLLGSRFSQEIAPPVALDRAEITGMGRTATTPFGHFQDVLVTAETTPLDPGVVEFKSFAPGIGLIADHVLRLVAVLGA